MRAGQRTWDPSPTLISVTGSSQSSTIPSRQGVGSKARVTATAGGRTDAIEIEVISAERPVTIAERNVGAGGARVATGTYRLGDTPGGGTRITFEYAWQQAPSSERIAAPLVRSVLRRGNQRAMARLAEQLATRQEHRTAA